MHKALRQALGQEPESMWMSAVGAVAAFTLPAALMLCAVACGWGFQ